MIKNKTIIADAKRCLMCYQPICDIACQKKVFPAGIIHALHLKNEAGAGLRLAGNASCLHCDDAKCEKACARGRWKSHATLTLLATQDLPTFGYNMIDPLKSWCWGSILFYPFKISRFS